MKQEATGTYKGFSYTRTGITTIVYIGGSLMLRNLYSIDGLHDAIQTPFITTLAEVKQFIDLHYSNMIKGGFNHA